MGNGFFEQLTTFEILAFIFTGGIIIGLLIMLPYKIIKEIKKHQ